MALERDQDGHDGHEGREGHDAVHEGREGHNEGHEGHAHHGHDGHNEGDQAGVEGAQPASSSAIGALSGDAVQDTRPVSSSATGALSGDGVQDTRPASSSATGALSGVMLGSDWSDNGVQGTHPTWTRRTRARRAKSHEQTAIAELANFVPFDEFEVEHYTDPVARGAMTHEEAARIMAAGVAAAQDRAIQMGIVLGTVTFRQAPGLPTLTLGHLARYL